MAVQNDHYYEVYDAVFARDGRTCQYCGTTTAKKYVLEHVGPERRNGPTEVYNCVVACDSCNHKKGNAVWVPNNIDALAALDADWAALIREHAEEYRPPYPTKSYRLSIKLTRRLAMWAAYHDVTESAAAEQALTEFLEREEATPEHAALLAKFRAFSPAQETTP